jgi:hypothetical protein
MKVYPNPFRDYLWISTGDAVTGEFSYSLTELSGRVLLKGTMRHDTGIERVRLHTGDLEPGCYLLHILSDNQERTMMVVRQ